MPTKRKQLNSLQNHTNFWPWLVILLALTLLISGIGGWIQFHHDSIWDSHRRLNIVIINPQNIEQLQVFSIESALVFNNQNQIVTIDLPGEVKMQLTHGYGDYLVSALYGLAVQENKMEILTQTLSYELGLPIDGWIVARVDNDDQDLKSEIKNWLSRDTISSLSWGDRFKIWWRKRETRIENIKHLNFSQGNWARKEQDIDGQSTIWFDKNTIDVQLPKLLSDSQIKQEGLVVKIINTTGVTGLGNQISRILTGTGLRTIEVSNSGGAIGQCVIQATSDAQKSYSVQRILEVFDCKLSEHQLTDSRVDIEFRAAFEQAKIWRGK